MMSRNLFLTSIILIFCASAKIWADPPVFHIVITRTAVQGDWVNGTIAINNDPLDFTSGVIGQTVESNKFKVAAASYQGTLRYWATKNFVQGPFGTIGHVGDFLLEVANVKADDGTTRTGILLHGGDNPNQSTGCILLGAVGKDPTTEDPFLDDDHPLRKLRIAFYGTDTPDSTPDCQILIDILDPPAP